MKATFPDGTLFEGTTEEFLAIRSQSATAGSGHKSPEKPSNASGLWNDKKARKFLDSLDPWNGGGRQKKLLTFLVKNGGRATHDEVINHLGVKNPQVLAGVLANITRNARREAKDDDVRVVRWMHDGKGIKGTWYYYIPEDILQLLKHIV